MKAALAAAALVLLTAGIAEAASSIDPTVPANGTSYSPTVIRDQFNRAIADINALQSANAGVSPPSNPSPGTLWLSTPQNGTTYTLNIWDGRGAAWLPIGALDTVANTWMPPLGGGTLPDVLSAITTDLGSVPQAALYVTGSNNIQSFGGTAPPGGLKVLQFTDSPTLINSATLVLPGGANITQGPGDSVIALALGGGNWKVLFDSRVAGGGGGGGGGGTGPPGPPGPPGSPGTGGAASMVLSFPPTLMGSSSGGAGGGTATAMAPGAITCASLPAGGCPADLAMNWPGIAPANAIQRIPVVRNVTCPAGLTGSVGNARTAATATTTITIQTWVAGTETSVGSAVFAAGSVTATLTAASPINLAAGNDIEIMFPAVPDTTLSDVAITFQCARF